MNMNLFRVRAGTLVLTAVLLPACKSVDVPKVPGITPYRMVIQQGNFISQEMVSQLKPGMTKEQVRFILGTPLVTDIFHADRWDYVFFREAADGKREQRNLTVVFENSKLARVLGDLMPADGAAPQASGFAPLAKPEAKPEAAAKPAAKPAPEAAKAPVVPPAPPAEASNPVSTGQNWSSGGAEAEKKPEAAPVAKEEEKKPAEEPKERGFFGRMLEKIGL
jgi:outer membrane protein assembly factor BamE